MAWITICRERSSEPRSDMAQHAIGLTVVSSQDTSPITTPPQFPNGHDPEIIPLNTVRQVDVHNEGDHLAIDLHVGGAGGNDGGVEVRLERGLGKQDAIWKLSRWCHRVVEGGDLAPDLPGGIDFDDQAWFETMLTVLAREV